MRITDTADLWWKNAVVYSLDIETFQDSDGDGVGDLQGLAQLMPFYPSPDKDDGYDITDYYNVDPRLGTLGDFVEVIRTAHDRGLRVIADLVINHTSDEHPWFKASRKSTDNPYRDWYVWRSDTPPDTKDKVVFPDVEDAIWEKDDRTGEWYLHNFYSFQPDLNLANPAVIDEIAKIIGFWTQLGVDGFRVDGVPFIVETTGYTPEQKQALGDPIDIIRGISRIVRRRTGDGMLLGEVNVPFKDQYKFFGAARGDGLTMQFDFVGMQAVYLAMARRKAAPIVSSLANRAKLDLALESQWANFLRNHDELTLDKLTDKQRQEVFDAFGPEPEMRVFDRGLKRRLPTMLGGDPRRIRMAYSLLFSLPGTPSLFYGEEIGMGENLALDGRMAVRTPMQWTSEASAGFSRAPQRRVVAKFPGSGYGPEHVNVADQRGSSDSLYQFMRELIFRYRQHPELGWGRHEVHPQQDPALLVLEHRWEQAMVLTLHNLGEDGTTAKVQLPNAPEGTVLVDVFSGTAADLADGGLDIPLEGYGHRWLRVQTPDDVRLY